MRARPLRLLVVGILGCGGAVMVSRGGEPSATGASPVHAAELSVSRDVRDLNDEADVADVCDALEPELEVHPPEPLPASASAARFLYPQTPPKPGEACHAVLRALQIDYTTGAPKMHPGVVDPVRITSPLHGVAFRHSGQVGSDSLVVDCRFALRLARAVDLMKERAVIEFQHFGSYNYRCIHPSDSADPDCVLSRHATGMAIDLAAFTIRGVTEIGETEKTFRVRYDFVERAEKDTTATCKLPRATEGDRFLKELACALWEQRAVDVVLTPNHRAEHRDHLHLEVEDGALPNQGMDPASIKPRPSAKISLR